MRLCGLACLVCTLLPAPAFACRLALLLALDVSASIDDREYALQSNGLAAAILSPDVSRAFLQSPDPVALSVFEWSGQRNQHIVVNWRLIETQSDLLAVAQQIRQPYRTEKLSPTSLGNALGFAARHFASAPVCARKTLDVSGDGTNNDGYPAASAYRAYAFGDVVVNALAIGGAQHLPSLVRYFEIEVIRGAGAFVEIANDHEDFERAMRRKLERELAPLAVGKITPRTPRHQRVMANN
ncbi:MAG: DUF1194 domain-containing protein [Paracoccaceae bacterium]